MTKQDKIERFEKGVGVGIDTFLDIITKGFYYKEGKEIYYMSNAIFIGNGYCPHSNSMVQTRFMVRDNAKRSRNEEDCHYWDWKAPNSVWNFEDYGKTWALTREELLEE